MSVVILTPDPALSLDPEGWSRSLQRLDALLGGQGIEAVPVAWTEADPAMLARAPLVLPLLAWGYALAEPRWLAAIDNWQAAGVRLANPAPMLRWNSDKSYLLSFAEKGAPVAPVIRAERLTDEVMAAAARQFGTDRLVAKPVVSAGAIQTIRWQPGMPLDGGPAGAALIQPFLPSIVAEGEVSLLHFDGAFSHAVLKRARTGDFRVQREWGGASEPWTPDAAALDAAARVLTAIGDAPLYARIDLARDLDGRWALIEAELIEPELFLELDPAGGAAFVRAIGRRYQI